MKNFYTSLSMLALFSSLTVSAQVGINNSNPQATLDINGNVIVRTVVPTTTAANYDFLVLNPTSKVVEKFNGSLTGSSSNTTIAKAETTTGISLLTVGFGGYNQINFAPADITINSGSNFSATTDSYTVPSTGIYAIYYEFRYDSGLKASLLGGSPGIGIFKTVGATTSLLDQRLFSGITIPLVLSLTISQSSINSVYNLTKNDVIYFGLNQGGVALGLLGSSFASVNIRKISD